MARFRTRSRSPGYFSPPIETKLTEGMRSWRCGDGVDEDIVALAGPDVSYMGHERDRRGDASSWRAAATSSRSTRTATPLGMTTGGSPGQGHRAGDGSGDRHRPVPAIREPVGRG